MMDKFINHYNWHIHYPDGDDEYWYLTVADAIADFGRLQVIHNGKCTIDLIELSAIRAAREKSAKMGGRNDSRNAK